MFEMYYKMFHVYKCCQIRKTLISMLRLAVMTLAKQYHFILFVFAIFYQFA